MKRANNWFFFADEDLKTAKAVLREGIYNQVCFHCQQGVEKTLKGFLRSQGRSVPKTHSLDDLVDICSGIDTDFQKIKRACVKLDDYYTSTRYPDVAEEVFPEGLATKQDAKEALEALRRIMDFVDKKLKEG